MSLVVVMEEKGEKEGELGEGKKNASEIERPCMRESREKKPRRRGKGKATGEGGRQSGGKKKQKKEEDDE